MTQEILAHKKSLIDHATLLKCLPHRYPFLLVDKIVSIEYGKKIIAIKNITFNEPQFTGHFPDKPIMPGVLIIEAMAQAGALIITADPEFDAADKLVYFMSIDNAKFRQIVVPGDVLELHVEVVQNRANVWKLAATAIVAGQKVAEAELKAMLVDKEKTK
jgi:3-hydroxyacyl-[acyl-carrier-protein] dehydratase